MIGLWLLSLLTAISNTLDISTDIIAITIGRISSIQLGIYNTLGYTAFLIALFIGGKLGDNGLIKIQVFAIVLSLIAYGVTLSAYLNTPGQAPLLLMMYFTYSIAQAFSMTSVTAFIHEFYASYQWEEFLIKRLIATRAFEALLLGFLSTGLAYILSNTYLYVICITIPAILAFSITRDPPLRIERIMYRIEIGLSRIESSVTNSLFIYELIRGDHRLLVKPRWRNILVKPKHRSPLLVILGLVLFRFSNSLLLVQLPVYLNKSLGLLGASILGVYALSRGILVVFYYLLRGTTSSIAVSLVLRALAPVVFLYTYLCTNSIVVALVLGLILYLNSVIDALLYTTYTEVLGRAVSTRYLMIGESVGLIATLLSGIVYSIIGYENIILATLIMLATAGLLLK
jgi:MFS family permease